MMSSPGVGLDVRERLAALQKQAEAAAAAANEDAQRIEQALAPKDRAAFSKLGRSFGRDGDHAALIKGWAQLVRNRKPTAISALISLVMRDSYLQAAADIRQLAKGRNIQDQQHGQPEDVLAQVDLQSLLKRSQHTIKITANLRKTLQAVTAIVGKTDG